MNKVAILVFATVFAIAGGSVPFLWGDKDLLGGWSIVLGMVGGLVGIWIGVVVARRVGQ